MKTCRCRDGHIFSTCQTHKALEQTGNSHFIQRARIPYTDVFRHTCIKLAKRCSRFQNSHGTSAWKTIQPIWAKDFEFINALT